MRINTALNIRDLRLLAKQRLPNMVFDYIDGGADDELAVTQNEKRLAELKTTWKSLVDVSKIDTNISILGSNSKYPFFIAPSASSRLFHPRKGETAVVRAAANAGIIYTASTLSAVSLENIAVEAEVDKWFQLYMWKDKALVESIVRRAQAAGFKGLVLTVDTPVAGNRERDPRNGFSIPPKVNFQTVRQAIVRPRYLLDVALSAKIEAANISHIDGDVGGIVEFINNQFDRSVTWRDLEWIRSIWDGPLIVKGISNYRDAKMSKEHGADAIWISNHGGRQLDSSPATIDLLGNVSAEFKGQLPIIFDGGVRRGSDVFKALAMGASAVAIGRAYLWGLAAAGEKGVARAIRILADELERTMALTGCPNIQSISYDCIA